MKIHCFNFIWILSVEVLPAILSALARTISSLSLRASPTGMVIEAKAYSKPWEAAPSSGTSVALSEDVFFRAFCLFLLIGRKRIQRLHFFNWLSNCKGCFTLSGWKVRGSNGWWVVDIFWFRQLRRSLNPNSVEGFIPSLSAIDTTHSWDLCLKGFLGLNHPEVVTLLLSLIPSLFGLHFCLLNLIFQPLSLLLKLLGFF